LYFSNMSVSLISSYVYTTRDRHMCRQKTTQNHPSLWITKYFLCNIYTILIHHDAGVHVPQLYCNKNISLFQCLGDFVSFCVNTSVGSMSYRHGYSYSHFTNGPRPISHRGRIFSLIFWSKITLSNCKQLRFKQNWM
jgi:hypothetical protein